MIETAKKIYEIEVIRFECEDCGSDLLFDPDSSSLECQHCGASEVIQTTDEVVEEYDLNRFLSLPSSQTQLLFESAMQVSCSDCGAKTVFAPAQIAGSCAFCTSQIVLQPEEADSTILPEGVVPFGVTKKVAASSLNSWIKFARGENQL